jgi:vacuolar iron transporter family protein
MKEISEQLHSQLVQIQDTEITEHFIYLRLSKTVKDKANGLVLEKIGNDELNHAEFWAGYTGRKAVPNKFKILWFYWISRVLGITFGIKLLERGEDSAQKCYGTIAETIPEALNILRDEEEHEKELIDMIEEERLGYIGAVVLGLNDALVELTGTLAGLSLALQNTRLIALAGLIIGVAAAFSMGASVYLSTKADGESAKALKAAAYTGVAYIITVLFLILPYLLIQDYIVCLVITMIIAIFIIFIFNYYISVAKGYNFHKRFWEMTIISLSVAALTFGISYLIKKAFGINV